VSGKNDSHKSIARTTDMNARVNSPVEIALKTPGAAGFEWTPIFDTVAIALVERRKEVDKRNLGASLKEVFKFRPLTSGHFRIGFALKRPWEDTVVERREFSLHVK